MNVIEGKDGKVFDTTKALSTGHVDEEDLKFLCAALFEDFKMRTKDIDAEYIALSNEAAELEENQDRLTKILEAKARVLERETDELIAAGKLEAGAEKGKELEAAKKNLERLSKRLTWIGYRLIRIEDERLIEAQAALNASFHPFQVFCFVLLDQTFTAMDKVWKTMEDFSAEMECDLSPMKRLDLTPPNSMGGGKYIDEKISSWFPRGT